MLLSRGRAGDGDKESEGRINESFLFLLLRKDVAFQLMIRLKSLLWRRTKRCVFQLQEAAEPEADFALCS